jgi:hypothetical protein
MEEWSSSERTFHPNHDPARRHDVNDEEVKVHTAGNVTQGRFYPSACITELLTNHRPARRLVLK